MNPHGTIHFAYGKQSTFKQVMVWSWVYIWLLGSTFLCEDAIIDHLFTIQYLSHKKQLLGRCGQCWALLTLQPGGTERHDCG
jgi:hypothetical protein